MSKLIDIMEEVSEINGQVVDYHLIFDRQIRDEGCDNVLNSLISQEYKASLLEKRAESLHKNVKALLTALGKEVKRVQEVRKELKETE